jgi:hypothetical protein
MRQCRARAAHSAPSTAAGTWPGRSVGGTITVRAVCSASSRPGTWMASPASVLTDGSVPQTVSWYSGVPPAAVNSPPKMSQATPSSISATRS